MMIDPQLAGACQKLAETADSALVWVSDPRNDPRVGQERSYLERTIRSHGYRARRLARSLDRPMSAGVFGPSQAGKSYLVSVLARKGEALTALFDDPNTPELDFIKNLNPYGEKEATGLVTRFSTSRVATPVGFPVALRLLTQTDILKILANSYFFDGDPQEEEALTAEAIDRHIGLFESRRLPAWADVLREEDVWDVEEYFQRHLRKPEARIFAPFWGRMAQIAPFLATRDRAELFSILWNRHRPLTDLFLELIDSLKQLGFAEEAFCRLEGLVPATDSILNVETLAGLGQPNAPAIIVSAAGHGTAELPRAVVTALAAELRIALKDTPWPFLEHTDLLDFPGYRSRTLHNLGRYLSESKAGALKELFLRGKVDYLFQRYTADQELTSMLLCLKPSNLDVTSLPAVIDDWIATTHGASAEQRRGRPVLLFFLLTMFDQHLSEKKADEGADASLRFQARLEASLLKPFAKVTDAWPLRWTPEGPFNNCYWIRNPNYKAEGIITYDGWREVAIRPEKVERIAELRAAYARVPEVGHHFREPLRAFDEVMRLNDGGISYLAENLALVCRPGMKRDQVQARLWDLKQQVIDTLKPHYVSSDESRRIEERTEVAGRIIADIEGCMERQAFGTFLRRLCLDRVQLGDALYEARLRGTAAGRDEPEPLAENEPKKNVRSRLLDIVRGADAPGADAPSQVTSRPLPGTGPVQARFDMMARTALQVWSQNLHEAAEDESTLFATGLSRETLKEVAAELIAAARRHKIESRIATRLSGISHMDRAELAASKAAIVAERLINGFVTTVGAAQTNRPVAYDATGIGTEPLPFQGDFIVGWVRAFYAEVIENAKSGDGLVHDPEQNALLGQLLDQLAGV